MDPRFLLADSIARLARAADRALARGLTRHDFFAICIDPGCGEWSGVVAMVAPDFDDCAEAAVVVGTVARAGFAQGLATRMPGLARGLKTRPSPGSVHAIALGMRSGLPCASLYVLTELVAAVSDDLGAAPSTWRSAW